MLNNSSQKKHRALIIDDETIYHSIIGDAFKMLGIESVAVSTFDEAIKEIKSSVETGDSFSIITIDNELKSGGAVYRLGKNILQKIKFDSDYIHLNMGCIMVTATKFSEREVLDLRDKFGLDYFIPKIELDLESLREGIKVASIPNKPKFDVDELTKMPEEKRRLSMLNETMIRYQNLSLLMDRNLAILKEKKAKYGIDVSISLENEISECEKNLVFAEEKVKDLEKQIKELT